MSRDVIFISNGFALLKTEFLFIVFYRFDLSPSLCVIEIVLLYNEDGGKKLYNYGLSALQIAMDRLMIPYLAIATAIGFVHFVF